jgi:prepilin-type N-terminal cleavage/methylation domain-containing protein
MNRLRHDERGFTLPELLITMIIALTVSLATFSLIDFVMRRSGEIATRVEAVQRGRTAMDQVTRLLRSQVCAWRSDDGTMLSSRSLDDATPSSVTPYTDFTNEALVGGVVPPPALRTLTLSTPTNGILTETTIAGQWSGGKVSYTYPGAAAKTRQVLTNVALYKPVGAPTPIPLFRYFAFNTADPPQPDAEIAQGQNRALTDDELETVAKITVTFRVLSSKGSANGSTVLTDDIYVRTADPNAEDPQPTCATT